MYGIPGDGDNHLAWELLEGLVEVDIRMVVCPPSAKDLYRMPFINDELAGRYFGLESIRRFAARIGESE